MKTTSNLILTVLTIGILLSCKKSDTSPSGSGKGNISFSNGKGCPKSIKVEIDGNVPSGFESIAGGQEKNIDLNPGTHHYKIYVLPSGNKLKEDDVEIKSESAESVNVCGQ